MAGFLKGIVKGIKACNGLSKAIPCDKEFEKRIRKCRAPIALSRLTFWGYTTVEALDLIDSALEKMPDKIPSGITPLLGKRDVDLYIMYKLRDEKYKDRNIPWFLNMENGGL